MSTILIALSLALGADAPNAPVRALAGGARTIDAVVTSEAPAVQTRPAVDQREAEPAFRPEPAPIV
jgi:hypothetical protein